MEEGVVPLSTTTAAPSSDYVLELDYMDELLLDGCWVETNDFPPPVSPFDPSSFSWPLPESNHVHVEFNKSNQDNGDVLASPANLENPESNKRWWIGPESSTSVMDRLIQALGYIKDCTRDKDALIQVWVPVTREGKRVLTTSNQPFSLDLNCPRLAHYREISVNYQFSADEEGCKEGRGLPGRVFMSKVPEWTPDVRFFSRDEYPRVRHAQQVDVRGTVAVPILEQGSHNCLGVIEVVLTTQKVQYRPELETVCKALEAVDLRSGEVSNPQSIIVSDLLYQAALPEILEVLKSACSTHGLPLAQTWVPCILQGKAGCRHSEQNLQNCISPVDSACYIGDPRIQGFHEACSDYHLMMDQGIVGKAFRTNQPCFSPDVTAYSRTEYPLSHYARIFGLQGAVAIRLRSICTGESDFVLELFLPKDCVALEDQKKMLTSLSVVIQNVCQTLRVVTDQELQDESGLASSSGIASIAEGISGEHNATIVKNISSGDGRLNRTTTGDKRRSKSDKVITLQVLRQHFAGSLKDAAKKLGVCPTTLKRICRQHGVQRWPSRKIKKVGHSLQKIQRVIDSVQGTSGVLEINSFYSNFPELASPTTPNCKKATKAPESIVLPPPAGSPTSSCSQNSNSSQCCSSEAQQPTAYSFSITDLTALKDRSDTTTTTTTLKRARTDANLLASTNDAVATEILPRSKSHVSLTWQDDVQKSDGTDPPPPPRIKVTYGEDNIRFRLKHEWRYSDLVEEISRRFGVEDPRRFQLKYLDDDAEWVLLTCDADLEECIDVWRTSMRGNAIKLWFLPNTSQRVFGEWTGRPGTTGICR